MLAKTMSQFRKQEAAVKDIEVLVMFLVMWRDTRGSNLRLMVKMIVFCLQWIFLIDYFNLPGLPHGWLATVDKFSGQVLFLHIESGVTQFQVPPGFDDLPEKKKNGDDMNDTEELSMDDDTVLPSAMEDVIMKSGTEDTEGGNSVSSGGLSAAPVERMDAFDQHDEDL